jgi:uncharacterized protein (TIGR02145 family)
MKKIVFLSIVILFANICGAQNVGIGTLTPQTSAVLDVHSTNKGFLPPRLTLAQRNAIQNPVAGLTIWCTDCNEMQVYNGLLWKNMSGHAASGINFPIIKLCNDTWMLKNLTVRNFRNGDTIPVVTNPAIWSTLTTPAMCWANNNLNNDTVYGPLYNWYAVTDPRGIAPEGWHVSTLEEWKRAAECVGGVPIAAVKMRDTSDLWNYNLPLPIFADNASGFTGLPGGFRWGNEVFPGAFEGPGTDGGFWWTTDELTASKAYARHLAYDGAMMLPWDRDKRSGFSIRCVKD